MLLIKPIEEQTWVKHEESESEYLIRPMNSAEYDALRRKSMKADGTLDFVAYARNFAAANIIDWKGVGDPSGPLPCNAENRAQFATAHCILIVPWLIARAQSLDNFRREEIDAAKNA